MVSSATAVTAALVMLGAAFTLLTVIVKDWVSVKTLSVASNTTAWSPASELVGVPLNVTPSKVNQDGRVVALTVTLSPVSGSVVVTG